MPAIVVSLFPRLNDLNEPAILHNLRQRFKGDKIYTYVGTILCAVNPFKMLPLYTPAIIDGYKTKGTHFHPMILVVAWMLIFCASISSQGRAACRHTCTRSPTTRTTA